MNALIIALPESLQNQLQQLAEREGVSVDQLAVSALTEKIAALMTPDYLTQRARRGNRHLFEQALARVNDIEPDQQDNL